MIEHRRQVEHFFGEVVGDVPENHTTGKKTDLFAGIVDDRYVAIDSLDHCLDRVCEILVETDSHRPIGHDLGDRCCRIQLLECCPVEDISLSENPDNSIAFAHHRSAVSLLIEGAMDFAERSCRIDPVVRL